MRVLVIAACLALCGVTSADKATPWSQGVSQANQKKALEIFKRGNTLFEEQKYTDALAEYEKALKLWDHPNIQFNLAICLFNIRQPLEAWDHLERALRYGEAPLGKRLYEEAQTYKALLESSLAQLEVVSDQDDVQVMVDGKELFTGKGKKKLRLLAGTHQLVATADGFKTESKALDLAAGKLTHEDVELAADEVKVEVKVKKVRENYERRWAWWIPWTAEGSGIALALIGTGVYLSARSDMKTYDAALAQQCPTGCKPGDITPALAQQEQSAERKSSIGIGFWAAGGAVAVAAGAMAVLNRPRLTERPQVTAVVAPGYAGVALTFSR